MLIKNYIFFSDIQKLYISLQKSLKNMTMSEIDEIEINEWMDEQQKEGLHNVFSYPSLIRQIFDVTKKEARDLFLNWQLKKWEN